MQSLGQTRKVRGFTLIEMLVVILIIFILIGIALAVGMQVQANSQIQLTKMELRNLQSALDWYHHKTGVYPDNMADFLADYQLMHTYQTASATSPWQFHSNVLSELPAQNVVTSTLLSTPNGKGPLSGVCEVLDGFGTPIQYCPPPTSATGASLWPVSGTTFPNFATPTSAVFVVINGTANGTAFTLPAASSNGHNAFFYSLGTQYNAGGTYSAPLTPADYMYSYAP